jgi:hypothetical protein
VGRGTGFIKSYKERENERYERNEAAGITRPPDQPRDITAVSYSLGTVAPSAPRQRSGLGNLPSAGRAAQQVVSRAKVVQALSSCAGVLQPWDKDQRALAAFVDLPYTVLPYKTLPARVSAVEPDDIARRLAALQQSADAHDVSYSASGDVSSALLKFGAEFLALQVVTPLKPYQSLSCACTYYDPRLRAAKAAQAAAPVRRLVALLADGANRDRMAKFLFIADGAREADFARDLASSMDLDVGSVFDASRAIDDQPLIDMRVLEALKLEDPVFRPHVIQAPMVCRAGIRQQTGTCFFNAVLNGFFISPVSRAILLDRVVRYYRALHAADPRLAVSFAEMKPEDVLSDPTACPREMLGWPFFSIIKALLCEPFYINAKVHLVGTAQKMQLSAPAEPFLEAKPSWSNVPSDIYLKTELSGLDKSMYPKWSVELETETDGGHEVIALFKMLRSLGFHQDEISSVGYRNASAHKPKPDSIFLVVLGLMRYGLVWTPEYTQSWAVRPSIETEAGEVFDLDHAAITLADQRSNAGHAIAGVFCNGQPAIYDSNQEGYVPLPVPCDWMPDTREADVTRKQSTFRDDVNGPVSLKVTVSYALYISRSYAAALPELKTRSFGRMAYNSCPTFRDGQAAYTVGGARRGSKRSPA